MTPQEELHRLIFKLNQLSRQQQQMVVEINQLRDQINALQATLSGEKNRNAADLSTPADEVPEIRIDEETLKKRSAPPPLPKTPVSAYVAKPVRAERGPANNKKSFDLEGFIGGNLINKVGILILIIGLGLFAKYAIDNGYFPPLVRLVASFLAGLALVLIGYRLRPRYKTYSAVLFSGGMAVLYFSAYGGFTFYDPALLPRNTSFILMVIFTVVTVLAAMIYNLEIIALLGMVGAYAVPLLLSDDSGNYPFFLTYIALINGGILLICLRKFWRLTLYISMALSWLIYAFWILVEYDPTAQTSNAWIFNGVFFGLFYTALLTYNIREKRPFSIDNLLVAFLNAFVFYGLGMVLLENSGLHDFQGGFTLANGLLHLGLAYTIYRPSADKKIFYALNGLFWLFLTIAIGVEFEAAPRALLWLGEATVLFGIGRRTAAPAFEIGSFLVLILGAGLLVNYWEEGYYSDLVHLKPLLNPYFASSIIALLCLSVMLWISQLWKGKGELNELSETIVGTTFILLCYALFFNEIYHQSEMAFMNSETNGKYQNDLLLFKHLWLLYYSLIFVLGLQLVNQQWFRRQSLAWVILVNTFLLILLFLFAGLYELNELRNAYSNPDLSPEFTETDLWIWIRYLGYGLIAIVVHQNYQLVQFLRLREQLGDWLPLFIHFLVLVFLSNELSTFLTLIMEVETDSLTHRVGHSVLWALYALLLIFVGFRKRSKLLRVAGIILFGLTLVKIFLVDLVDISRESRIFLFVAVGILLLVTSYLYQKYAEVLMRDGEE